MRLINNEKGDEMYSKKLILLLLTIFISYSYAFTKDFKLIKTLQNTFHVPTIYFSPGDKYFACENKSGSMNIYSLPSFRCVKTIYGQHVYNISISPDNEFCAIAIINNSDSKIEIYKLPTFELIKIYSGPFSKPPYINFSKNGVFFEISTVEVSKLYLLPEFKLVKTFVDRGNLCMEEDIDYSKSGEYFAGINDNFVVVIYRLSDFKFFDSIKITENEFVHAVYFSPNERYIVVQTEDYNPNEPLKTPSNITFKPQNVKIYSFPNIKLIRTLRNQSGVINRGIFSPNSEFFANVDHTDNLIKIYSVPDYKLYKALTDHKDFIRSIIFSDSGNYFASGGQDNKVNIYYLGR